MPLERSLFPLKQWHKERTVPLWKFKHDLFKLMKKNGQKLKTAFAMHAEGGRKGLHVVSKTPLSKSSFSEDAIKTLADKHGFNLDRMEILHINHAIIFVCEKGPRPARPNNIEPPPPPPRPVR